VYVTEARDILEGYSLRLGGYGVHIGCQLVLLEEGMPEERGFVLMLGHDANFSRTEETETIW